MRVVTLPAHFLPTTGYARTPRKSPSRHRRQPWHWRNHCTAGRTEDGFAVAVNYTDPRRRCRRGGAQIRAMGGRAMAVQADVADRSPGAGHVARVDAELGRLTALVNNAGVVDKTARVDQMSLQRLTRMFDINVIGSFLCAREAVLRMSTRHGGTGGAIVNVSSAAARLRQASMSTTPPPGARWTP